MGDIYDFLDRVKHIDAKLIECYRTANDIQYNAIARTYVFNNHVDEDSLQKRFKEDVEISYKLESEINGYIDEICKIAEECGIDLTTSDNIEDLFKKLIGRR